MSPYAYVFFDFETTGLSSQRDRIIQIGAVYGDKEFRKLVNPGIAISAPSTKVHGITNERVSRASRFGEAISSFFSFIESNIDCESVIVLTGYNNLTFDNYVLKAELRRHGIDLPRRHFMTTDVIQAVRAAAKTSDFTLPTKWNEKYGKEKPDLRLGSVYRHITGKVLEDAHDAVSDCKATRLIMERVQEYLVPVIFTLDVAVDNKKRKLETFPLDRKISKQEELPRQESFCSDHGLYKPLELEDDEVDEELQIQEHRSRLCLALNAFAWDGLDLM
jgi:DNA polymerase III epsilon subunit-like protein